MQQIQNAFAQPVVTNVCKKKGRKNDKEERKRQFVVVKMGHVRVFHVMKPLISSKLRRHSEHNYVKFYASTDSECIAHTDTHTFTHTIAYKAKQLKKKKKEKENMQKKRMRRAKELVDVPLQNSKCYVETSRCVCNHMRL